MSEQTVLALDVGGANLKIADGRGYAVSRAFALWREPQRLAAALREMLTHAPHAEHVVATMTGELADCYRTKAEGVLHITTALMEAADNSPLRIYLTDGTLVEPPAAIARPLEAASSNWHALARFAATLLPERSGLLLDIGSTTCDIIPILSGWPISCGAADLPAHAGEPLALRTTAGEPPALRLSGKTDPERLAAGELVYTGVVRSPVCAVVAAFPWRGCLCPVAQELFATTLDAYLMLGDLPEQPESHQTADGRAATRDHAHDRLARMICADRDLFDRADALAAAQAIADAQSQRIADCLRAVIDRTAVSPLDIVISGQGEFLARRVLALIGYAGRVTSLAEHLGTQVSQAAPAHALAILASSQK